LRALSCTRRAVCTPGDHPRPELVSLCTRTRDSSRATGLLAFSFHTFLLPLSRLFLFSSFSVLSSRPDDGSYEASKEVTASWSEERDYSALHLACPLASEPPLAPPLSFPPLCFSLPRFFQIHLSASQISAAIALACSSRDRALPRSPFLPLSLPLHPAPCKAGFSVPISCFCAAMLYSSCRGAYLGRLRRACSTPAQSGVRASLLLTSLFSLFSLFLLQYSGIHHVYVSET
jgi:hypothetical protein